MKSFLILLGFAALISCQQTPIQPIAQNLGTLELRLDNSGNNTGQVARVRVNSGLQLQGDLREADVTFTALTTTATQNDGAFDYVQAQFSVQNSSSTVFENLTLYAVAKSGNIGGTAIKSITNFGGLTDALEQARISKLVTPTHGLNISSSGASLIAGREDLQFFIPDDVTNLQSNSAWNSSGFSSNDKVLGYGFVARRCVPDCTSPTLFVRDIPSGQSGLITIALKIPRSSGTAYNFVMTFAVVNEPTTRVTRSVYPPETLSSAENRLTAFGAPSSGEIMQQGLARGTNPSSSFTNQGADTMAVSSNTDDYTALGLGRLSSGFNHTCALTAVGAAYCWGNNPRGQLGNNSVVASAVPVAVDGTLRFSSLSAGFNLTCAVTTAGKSYCWGSNDFGALGNNSSVSQSLVPVAVSNAGGLVFSSLGVSDSSSVCALTTTGAAYCWGRNNFRQLGNGTNLSSIPIAVTGGLTFSSLSVGGGHSCALTLSGVAYCWGFNGSGELGNNSTTNSNSNVPVAVLGGLTFSSLGLGTNHSCGLTLAGAAYCWGYNSNGQLGDNTTTNQKTPVVVQDGLTFSSLDGGEFHTCALTPNGTAYCWGNNSNGQLGIQNTQNKPTPQLLAGASRFSSLSSGRQHSCAITNAGKNLCWGDNNAAQLGINIFGNTPVNPKVPNAITSQIFSSVEVGDNHSCGLTSSGAAYCWGDNSFSALGNGSNSSKDVPVAVSGGLLFSKISAGGAHTCGLTITTKFIYCWGYNFFGQLGDSTSSNRNTPVKIDSTLTFTDVSAGYLHSCGVAVGGVVLCWGDNRDGQLGNSGITALTSSTPIQITGSFLFSSVSAGGFYTCGISGTDSYCWGRNSFGNLGDGSTTGKLNPTRVFTSLVFTSLTTGENHTCGKATNNFLYCWGSNTYGQIGNSTTSTTEILLPTQVTNSSFSSSPSAGKDHTCAVGITITNCWGRNQSGQLGNDSLNDTNKPTLVSGSLFFSSVSTGSNHSCALTVSGIAYCWGSNASGQIGRSFVPYLSPTRDDTTSFKL